MSAAGDALGVLAATLRGEGSLLSAYVIDPRTSGAGLGALAAAGPRAAAAPADYALVVESVREGYLLHYAEPRVVAGVDPDLALLGGDYLYALGLERLAELGDLEAVRELSDLISLAAQLHEGERAADRARREADTLWLSSAAAIGAGASGEHASAKAALRAESVEASTQLLAAAERTAVAARLQSELGDAIDSIDFAPDPSGEFG